MMYEYKSRRHSLINDSSKLHTGLINDVSKLSSDMNTI